MDAANIPAQVEAFFELLEQTAVDYLLVGGVAMLAHVRGRNTEDIDLVISLRDQKRLAPEVMEVERIGFFAESRFQSLRIDFLQAEEPFFGHVLQHYAERREFGFLREGRTLPCATPEGLLLLKLYALPSLYRQGKVERAKIYEGDVGALLAAVPAMDTEKLLAVLTRYGVLESDCAELRKIIAEQRPRAGRFGSGERAER